MRKEKRLLQSKAIPVPFTMCSPTRVQIALKDLWAVARIWAFIHGYHKQGGARPAAPCLLRVYRRSMVHAA